MQLGSFTIPPLALAAVVGAGVLVVLVLWGVWRVRRTPAPDPLPVARPDASERPQPSAEDWTGEAAGGPADPPRPARPRTVADVVAERGGDTGPLPGLPVRPDAADTTPPRTAGRHAIRDPDPAHENLRAPADERPDSATLARTRGEEPASSRRGLRPAGSGLDDGVVTARPVRYPAAPRSGWGGFGGRKSGATDRNETTKPEEGRPVPAGTSGSDRGGDDAPRAATGAAGGDSRATAFDAAAPSGTAPTGAGAPSDATGADASHGDESLGGSASATGGGSGAGAAAAAGAALTGAVAAGFAGRSRSTTDSGPDGSAAGTSSSDTAAGPAPGGAAGSPGADVPSPVPRRAGPHGSGSLDAGSTAAAPSDPAPSDTAVAGSTVAGSAPHGQDSSDAGSTGTVAPVVDPRRSTASHDEPSTSERPGPAPADGAAGGTTSGTGSTGTAAEGGPGEPGRPGSGTGPAVGAAAGFAAASGTAAVFAAGRSVASDHGSPDHGGPDHGRPDRERSDPEGSDPEGSDPAGTAQEAPRPGTGQPARSDVDHAGTGTGTGTGVGSAAGGSLGQAPEVAGPGTTGATASSDPATDRITADATGSGVPTADRPGVTTDAGADDDTGAGATAGTTGGATAGATAGAADGTLDGDGAAVGTSVGATGGTAAGAATGAAGGTVAAAAEGATAGATAGSVDGTVPGATAGTADGTLAGAGTIAGAAEGTPAGPGTDPADDAAAGAATGPADDVTDGPAGGPLPPWSAERTVPAHEDLPSDEGTATDDPDTEPDAGPDDVRPTGVGLPRAAVGPARPIGPEPVSRAVQQALAARAVRRARMRRTEDGDGTPNGEQQELPLSVVPSVPTAPAADVDVRDRLLGVLLADPTRAVDAARLLGDSQERIEQLGDVLRRRRADLAGAVRHLHECGLDPVQIGRLANMATADVRTILDGEDAERG